jgi:hypothetical protein
MRSCSSSFLPSFSLVPATRDWRLATGDYFSLYLATVLDPSGFLIEA